MLKEIINISNYNFINCYSIPNFLVAFAFLLLGTFVIYKQPKRQDSWAVGIYSLAIFWWQGWFFLAYNCINIGLIYQLIKIGFIGVMLLSLLIAHQTLLLMGMHKNIKRILFPNYLITIPLIIVLLSTNLLLDKPHLHFWGYYTTNGRFFIYYLIYFFIILGSSLTTITWHYLFKKNKYNEIELLRIKFFIIGFVFCVLGAVDFLPNFGFEIYPFAYVCFSIFGLIMSYGIIKYNYFDIETALHQTLAWAVSSALVLLPLIIGVSYSLKKIMALGTLTTMVFISAVYFVIIFYRSKIQPAIDALFLKKKFQYDESLIKITEKALVAADLEKMGAGLMGDIYNILFPKNICLFIKNNGVLSLLSCMDKNKRSAISLTDDSPILRWVLENRRLLYKNSVLVNPKNYKIGPDNSSWPDNNNIEVVVPILFAGELIGVIVLSKKKSLKEYRYMDLKLLENVGRDIGLAVHNLIFYHKNIEKEREIKKVLEVEVESRTKELLQKNKDLAQFNELAVDRELKMVELKNKIESLERSLAAKA